METTHKIYFKNASEMSEVESDTVDLLITSPPYPMIEMWDSLFSSSDTKIKKSLEDKEDQIAFNLMHEILDKVWEESARVLKVGGMACVNIGDATRTINGSFQLFPNHTRISNFFQKNGFIVYPCILWRKPTNSPTKFLGSGMLPPNAYITLEHEYILIFRKGHNKRKIKPKFEHRYSSAYFWEERNLWFSDLWMDIRGTFQNLNNKNGNKNKIRERSAAFPLNLPYRLINMFSIHGDTILDPFWGTGTTTLAAMISARNSIGYEINPAFLNIFKQNLLNIKKTVNSINNNRLEQHVEFSRKYKKSGKDLKYTSTHYNFPIMTKQEVGILFYTIKKCVDNKNNYTVYHEKFDFEQKTKLIQSRLVI